MDGLFTQEDIDNRFFIMALCMVCRVWTKFDTRTKNFVCVCGSDKYDTRESRSIRSWVATKDMKKEKKTRKNNGGS